MSLDRVFVIGAGLMGHGIAQVSAAAGKQVTLADRTAELAEKGKARVAGNLARQVEKGKLAQEDADALLARISTGVGPSGAGGHDIVIEAVFEDESVKRDTWQALSRGRRPERDLRQQHEQHQHHLAGHRDRPARPLHRPALLLARAGDGPDRDHPRPRDR